MIRSQIIHSLFILLSFFEGLISPPLLFHSKIKNKFQEAVDTIGEKVASVMAYYDFKIHHIISGIWRNTKNIT